MTDGGPAFPRPAGPLYEDRRGDEQAMNLEQDGMSLRDYFAGQAITYIKCQGPVEFKKAAELAYQMGDHKDFRAANEYEDVLSQLIAEGKL